jgi:hypothetical protein
MLVFLTAYSSCARNLRLRDSGLFYSSLSGEYAFRFSTGIGTEPVPSPTIKVRIVVPGQIADKLITDAGSAFGRVDQVNESDSTGELSFLCQNLANDPGARIKVALWYQRSGQGLPSVQIQDTSEGPAREVGSIE